LLIFSDIPNNRLLKYDEQSGQLSVLRQPSSYASGNARDRDGRLLSCEQDQRAVLRTEYDGKLTVIASTFNGKKLNGPHDIVARSDGTIWFSDPGYGLGSYYESDHQTGAELPRAVYRVDPRIGRIDVATEDQVRPNGLAFSPDEKTLYISDTGITDGPDKPSDITAYDVDDKGKLVNRRTLFDLKKAVPAMEQAALKEMGNPPAPEGRAAAGDGTPRSGTTQPPPSATGPQAGLYRYGVADGIRVDVEGNIWAGTGWAGPVIDGVTVIAPDGAAIGRIFMPEVVANLAFGGAKRNRLFMAGSTSLYALYVNIAGTGFG
jgi:gluconolactonase